MFADPAAEEKFLAAMANRGFYVFTSPSGRVVPETALPPEAAGVTAVVSAPPAPPAPGPTSAGSEPILNPGARLAA